MAQQLGLYTHGRIGSASHTRSKAMVQRVAQLTKRPGWPVRFARPSAAHRAAWPSRSGGPQCARTGATGAWSPQQKPAWWHGRPRLAGARGGARLVAQARGSLGAGARQGVRRGSLPEWRAGGEEEELGRAVAHVDAGRRGGGRP
jgi:hypothetical protein